ncbi:MAG: hypothetical protein R6T98_05300 [Desulfatiglandales bacterium]|jgi:hypothetical protein
MLSILTLAIAGNIAMLYLVPLVSIAGGAKNLLPKLREQRWWFGAPIRIRRHYEIWRMLMM